MSNILLPPSEIALSKLVNGVFPELFSDFIGQNATRTRIFHYLRSYLSTRIFPNSIFLGQRGNGKSSLARETAKGLLRFSHKGELELNMSTQLPVRKVLREVNCSSLPKSADDFLMLLIKLAENQDVTLFFDEASEIPYEVAIALLTILEKNKLTTNYTSANSGLTFNCDFRRQTFLFATTQPQKVLPDLLDRLKRFDLEEYTRAELAQIIQKGSPNVSYEAGVLDLISSVCRGNARNANDYAAEIKTYLGKDEGTFSLANWEELKSILSILPLGLNTAELNIMRYLQSSPQGISLTALSAKMNMTREAVQRDGELYLLKNSLITIEPAKGRVLTQKGRDYLQSLAR